MIIVIYQTWVFVSSFFPLLMKDEFRAFECKGNEGVAIDIHNHRGNPSPGYIHFHILVFETKSREWSMGTTIPYCKQYTGGS